MVRVPCLGGPSHGKSMACHSFDVAATIPEVLRYGDGGAYVLDVDGIGPVFRWHPEGTDLPNGDHVLDHATYAALTEKPATKKKTGGPETISAFVEDPDA